MGGEKIAPILEKTFNAIVDKKGEDVVCLDVRKITPLFDYVFICSAETDIQARAISDEIYIKLKKNEKTIPLSIEGYEKGSWIVMDYGDFLVHIFLPEKREYYNLEDLWIEAKRVEFEKK